jgi:hypothetical protein
MIPLVTITDPNLLRWYGFDAFGSVTLDYPAWIRLWREHYRLERRSP